MTIRKKRSEAQIAQKDAAETFGESDVSLSFSASEVSNESIQLMGDVTDSFDVGSGNDGFTGSVSSDVQINVGNTYFTQLAGYVDSGASSSTFTVYGEGGKELVSKTIDSPDGDTKAEFSESDYSRPFESGETVTVTQTASGADILQNDTDYYGNLMEIQPNTLYSGNYTSYVLQTTPDRGSVVVEWPDRNDVYRWDAATFQTTPDGETVEVYVEEDDGSSWTKIAGPISRGDQIDADPGSQVRFRVELSRSDTANNPTLDAIYRRWVV